MSFVYILKSRLNGAYYIGSSDDVLVRLSQHNKGLVRSTKRYVPWHLIYSEEYATLSQARKRESQIKSWKSRSAIEKLVTSKI